MDATTIRDHAKSGSEWLIDKMDADGSWQGLAEPRIDAYYKAAWTLTSTGHDTYAHKVLTHIRENYLQENGDLGPYGHDAFGDIHHLYPNAYVVIGSMRCGRYDIAQPTRRFLLTRQHPRTGGFYSQRDVPGSRSRTDTISTSAAGLACLAAGKMEAARQAGDYLQSIVNRQPNSEEFFFSVESDGNLKTAFDDSDDTWWGVVKQDEPDQCWYAVGLPFAFLLQLADATSDERYRETADWYYEFQQSCVNPWEGGSSGKAAWATSMLYRATGEESYRDVALSISENVLIDSQNDDGGWASTDGEGYASGNDGGFENADFDISAEYTLWLSLVSSNLLARDQ